MNVDPSFYKKINKIGHVCETKSTKKQGNQIWEAKQNKEKQPKETEKPLKRTSELEEKIEENLTWTLV